MILAFTALLAAASVVWLLVLPFVGRTHDRWDQLYDSARAALETGRLDDALRDGVAAAEIAPRLGARQHEPRVFSALALAEIEWKRGNLDGAERYCLSAIELLRRHPVPDADAEGLLQRIRGAPSP